MLSPSVTGAQKVSRFGETELLPGDADAVVQGIQGILVGLVGAFELAQES